MNKKLPPKEENQSLTKEILLLSGQGVLKISIQHDLFQDCNELMIFLGGECYCSFSSSFPRLYIGCVWRGVSEV